MSYDDMSLDEDEAIDFLRRLMPQGFADPEILAELAPEGWEQSPYLVIYHPELVVPFPEMDPLLKDRPERPIDPDWECRQIIGRTVWEILADDHSVIVPDGRRVDLGNYDDASAVLDLFDRGEIDEEPGAEDWLDMWDRGRSTRFSCDMVGIEEDVDCRPLYELVFRRMQAVDMDWIYQFPQLRLFSAELPQAPAKDGSADSYSPIEDLQEELEHKEAVEESERKQAKLDERNQEEAEKAAKEVPPVIVQAYMNVFGRRPSGWPPA